VSAKPTLVQLILNAKTAGKAMLTAANAAAQKVLLDLGNVDNTSDANKPVSTAQQTAIDAKIGGTVGTTTNRLPKSSGTGGLTLQASGITVDASNNISSVGSLGCGAITATGLTTTSGLVTIGNSTSGVKLGGVTGSGDSIEVALSSSIPRFSAVVGGAYVGEFGVASSNSYLQSATGLIRLRGTSIACRNNGNSADAPLTAEAITASGLMCAGVYTFATVPSASSNTGKFLRISDRAQKHAYSDGTNWRFLGDDAVIS
jgi:hypothetical protein